MAALIVVIALLKISEYSGWAAKYSNTGMPSVTAAAGLPVRTEWIASA